MCTLQLPGRLHVAQPGLHCSLLCLFQIPQHPKFYDPARPQVQLMEAMIDEQAAAVAAAGHPPPALQQFAADWGHQPWGGIAESYLRHWTLAAVRVTAAL